MNLGSTMLCEISQAEKDKHCMISFLHGIWKHGTLKQRVECGGLGLGAEKWREVGQMGQILSDKIISSGALTFNMVTIINNSVLYTGKLQWE